MRPPLFHCWVCVGLVFIGLLIAKLSRVPIYSFSFMDKLHWNLTHAEYTDLTVSWRKLRVSSASLILHVRLNHKFSELESFSEIPFHSPSHTPHPLLVVVLAAAPLASGRRAEPNSFPGLRFRGFSSTLYGR